MNSLDEELVESGFIPRVSIFALSLWLDSVKTKVDQAKLPRDLSTGQSLPPPAIHVRTAKLVQTLLAAHVNFDHRKFELFHGSWEALIRELRPTAVDICDHYRIDSTFELSTTELQAEKKQPKKLGHSRLDRGICLTPSAAAAQLMIQPGISQVINLQTKPKERKQNKDILSQPVPSARTVYFGRCNQKTVDVVCIDPKSGGGGGSGGSGSAAAAAAANGSLVAIQLKSSETPALGQTDSLSTDSDLRSAFKKWLAYHKELADHFGSFTACSLHAVVKCQLNRSCMIGLSVGVSSNRVAFVYIALRLIDATHLLDVKSDIDEHKLENAVLILDESAALTTYGPTLSARANFYFRSEDAVNRQNSGGGNSRKTKRRKADK